MCWAAQFSAHRNKQRVVNAAAGQALFRRLVNRGEIFPFTEGDQSQPLADLFDKKECLLGRDHRLHR